MKLWPVHFSHLSSFQNFYKFLKFHFLDFYVWSMSTYIFVHLFSYMHFFKFLKFSALLIYFSFVGSPIQCWFPAYYRGILQFLILFNHNNFQSWNWLFNIISNLCSFTWKWMNNFIFFANFLHTCLINHFIHYFIRKIHGTCTIWFEEL